MRHITIAGRIKEYRAQEGMTQAEFAKLAGVSPQAVSKWEREQGYPDITLLCPLARLLNCKVDDFFEGEGYKKDCE